MALVNDSAQQWHHLDGIRFWGFDISYISVTEWGRRREPEERMVAVGLEMFGACLPLYCSAAFVNNSLMSCQSS